MSSSISVAVRVRPFSEREHQQLASTNYSGPALFLSDPSTYSTPQPPRNFSSSASSHNSTGAIRKVLKVLDERILVFDPPESNPVSAFQKVILPVMGKKTKDIRFCFDRVFDEQCGQEEVYDGSAKELVGHVMDGFHSTVFAYGATGCGKTHTISGSQDQPGIVFLIMKDLFSRIAAKSEDTDFSLSVSYLEIYNENIRDLLAPESGALPLRESNGVATPAGLSTKEPTSASDVVEWITLGNVNRTVNATEANATSSRSHAVLRVTVTQKPKAGGLTDEQSTASLSVIDLAGSERASVTKNKGERLNEGANINRSLLALGNCINALCDPRKRGHVPYRDSKLTRLLKQSLGGNCKTVMIVCVSPSSAHYDETHNTLQYANRAKEIKTKAIRNFVSVDRHVGQYCAQIQEQATVIASLKAQLSLQKGTATAFDREEDYRVVRIAKSKLSTTWESARRQLVAGERAQSERNIIESTLQLLRQWKGSVLISLPDTTDSTSSSSTTPFATQELIKSKYETLIRSLCQASLHLREEITRAEGARDPYTVLRGNLVKGMTSDRATAIPLLNHETQAFDLRLESSLAEARTVGLSEGMKVQARLMESLAEARSIAGQNLESGSSEESSEQLKGLVERIERANREVFTALVSSGLGSSTNGVKRGMETRSPADPQTVWAEIPRKAPRASLAGFGSAPSGAFSSPQFQRTSPKKQIGFARSTVKKKKEVQWKDKTGDGWQLEEPSPPERMAPVASTSNLMPPPPVPALWTASSTLSSNLGSASAARMMEAQLKQRSSATGSLRAKASFSRAPPLASLSEDTVSKPFSFLRDNPRPSVSSTSTPFQTSSANENSSFESSISTPADFVPITASSTFKSLNRSPTRVRRISNIGPQRSSKPNRRTSYIAPPTPAGKAARAFGSSVVPLSMRKSPRKVPLTARKPSIALGGGPSAFTIRRESSLPTFGGGRRSGSGGRSDLAGSLGVGSAKGGWR